MLNMLEAYFIVQFQQLERNGEEKTQEMADDIPKMLCQFEMMVSWGGPMEEESANFGSPGGQGVWSLPNLFCLLLPLLLGHLK